MLTQFTNTHLFSSLSLNFHSAVIRMPVLGGVAVVKPLQSIMFISGVSNLACRPGHNRYFYSADVVDDALYTVDSKNMPASFHDVCEVIGSTVPSLLLTLSYSLLRLFPNNCFFQLVEVLYGFLPHKLILDAGQFHFLLPNSRNKNFPFHFFPYAMKYYILYRVNFSTSAEIRFRMFESA